MLPSGRTPSGHVAFAPVHVAPLHWRGFVEVLDAGPSRHGAQVVRLIGQLYHIETGLRAHKPGPALRESERAWRSAPVVRRIHAVMKVMLPKHRPQSPMGRALAYGLGHWEAFAKYLQDGRFEIDNNLVYAARGINEVMPPPDLCRVHKLEAHVPVMFCAEPYSHAA